MLCIALGCIAVLLSLGRDGFDKGLFQGATVALMVLGAYLLGTAIRSRSTSSRADGSGTHDLWLPSRDEH